MFALKLICNYKINHSFSSISSLRGNLLSGITRWSIMRPFLLKIFIVNLFLVTKETDFASYNNNNNIYCSNDCVNDNITLLGLLRNLFCGSQATSWRETEIHVKWILEKRVVQKPVWVSLSRKSQHARNWLDEDVQIDQQTNFHDRVNCIPWKASQKLKTLAGKRRKIIMNYFSNVQFNPV